MRKKSRFSKQARRAFQAQRWLRRKEKKYGPNWMFLLAKPLLSKRIIELTLKYPDAFSGDLLGPDFAADLSNPPV